MRQDFMDEVESTSKAFDSLYKVPNKKAFKVLTPTEWKARYIAYMLKEGLSEDDAQDYFDGIEFGSAHSVYDCSDDPEDAAEEDLTYG